MRAKSGTPADIFSADDESFEFKSAAELQHPTVEKAVPPVRQPPPTSPSQRHQDLRAPRAASIAKLETEVASPKSPSSVPQGFRVWRAAAVLKRESAAAQPLRFPSFGQQDASLGLAASPLSFPPLRQQAFRVWRAAAVAHFDKSTVSETARETEVAIKTVSDVSDRQEEHGSLPEFEGAAGDAGTLTPSSMAVESDAGGHLPAAALYDFDLACKRALKEV